MDAADATGRGSKGTGTNHFFIGGGGGGGGGACRPERIAEANGKEDVVLVAVAHS